METYRLEIRERAGGIDADVYGEDGLVEESTRAYFENYRIETGGDEAVETDEDETGETDEAERTETGGGETAATESGAEIENGAELVRETTTDVTSLDLQYERDSGGFDFRLIGDDELLVSVRLEDDDLTAVNDGDHSG